MASKSDNPFDPRTAIYTPAQAATYALEAIRKAKENYENGSGITIPIEQISEYVPPVMPGQIMSIIGQTSNYKSGFMHFMEHEAAKKIDYGGSKDHIIIHVSVEECVEEQSYIALGRETGDDAGELARGHVQDWNLLEHAAYRVGRVPIYRLGDSLARAEDMPHLYISNMILAIKELVSGNILDFRPKVAGIFFDYLQAFPIDPEWRASSGDQQRRLQVRSDMYRLRQCAAMFACPIFVAVQAKQNLEGTYGEMMLPGIYDGSETSAVAERSDRIITLWMPKSTNPLHSMVRMPSGKSFVVRDNQLWVKVAKQRGRLAAGGMWPCVIDYPTNAIALDKNVLAL